jgi:hypothetical protein
VDKTKVIIQTRKTIADQVIHINNQDTERVDSFVYLGSSLSTTNDEIIEIRIILYFWQTEYISQISIITTNYQIQE